MCFTRLEANNILKTCGIPYSIEGSPKEWELVKDGNFQGGRNDMFEVVDHAIGNVFEEVFYNSTVRHDITEEVMSNLTPIQATRVGAATTKYVMRHCS